jgi:hypothetical protein
MARHHAHRNAGLHVVGLARLHFHVENIRGLGLGHVGMLARRHLHRAERSAAEFAQLDAVLAHLVAVNFRFMLFSLD